MALQITEAEVASLLTPQDALEAVRDAFRDFTTGEAVNVVRTRARASSAMLHNMSAASSKLQLACAKVYLSSAKGVASHLLLYDFTSGGLRALIEANELGRLRTAAASVTATTVVLKTADTVGIIGTGFQAEGVVRAYQSCREFPLKRIIIFGRDKARLETFVAKAKQKSTIEISQASSLKSLLEQTDVLVTVTSSAEPLFALEDLARIQHISALGSNSLARRELAPRVLTAASMLLVDSLEAAKQEGGNFLLAIESGKLNWAKVGEIGAMIGDKEKAQAIKQGFSIFCSHGLAVQDLYLASRLLQKKSGS